MGNSKPLLRCTVKIVTASASVSSRRVASEMPVSWASAIRARNIDERTDAKLGGGHRRVQALAEMAQIGQHPLAAAQVQQPLGIRSSVVAVSTRRRLRESLEHLAPPADALREINQRLLVGGGKIGKVQPKKQLKAACRTDCCRVCCSRASNEVSQSRAMGDANTELAPCITAGTPAAISRSRIASPRSFFAPERRCLTAAPTGAAAPSISCAPSRVP